MDSILEYLRRDAVDSARFLRWLGRVLGLLRTHACGACNDNPLRTCASCYEDGLRLP